MRTFSVSEAADLLRVTRWTVYRHVELVDVSGTWRVEEAAILRTLTTHTETRKEQAPMNSIPTLYTFEEVAERHPRLTARALADGARAGKFEHIRFGRKRLMTEEQIAKLLAESTVASREDEALARVRNRRRRSANAA